MIMESLYGLGPFALYFAIALASLFVFKFVYTLITPHDEWKLVKENNVAAAVALVGTLIGFAIALGSAASNSVSLVDFVIWAVVALVAQLIAYAIVRFALLPKIVRRIEEGEVAAGVILGGLSIAIGILNAASMTW
ncbi:DUF350 domain-containing protein [Salinibius halmophilus]|uniref:DUF350 domain-containing protein n=1 Tax=Salinibius halmophilus TaxID=1853216 RepID=UPI000E6680E9|nr:DUF350 domain-containing protein [Salinibius halmophilus]